MHTDSLTALELSLNVYFNVRHESTVINNDSRVIDQTSSGINNRQSVCREKKDFPVSDCIFQELFMSL